MSPVNRDDGHRPQPNGLTDVRGEFEDRLWNDLGAHPRIRPSPDFAGRVGRAADGIGRPLRRHWPWIPAVAAAGVVAFIVMRGTDDRESQRPTPAGSAAQALDALSDEDFLAFQIDQLAIVNQDWFGG